MGDMLKHRILLVNAELMGTYLPSVLLKHKSKNQKKLGYRLGGKGRTMLLKLINNRLF